MIKKDWFIVVAALLTASYFSACSVTDSESDDYAKWEFSGYVLDASTGKGLANASITYQDGGKQKEVFTKEDGSFFIDNLTYGTLSFSFSYTEINKKDRESISRKVFERIAREGRKYGLSLLVSSQRPSELSKTVLSQCNSFIVHRIQNPDDQVYIRKLVSSANSEILNQLPTLPQQHVIVMGDCVRTPVVAKMNTASPKPNSNNPEFIQNWLKEEKVDYQGVANKWMEIDSKNTENNN